MIIRPKTFNVKRQTCQKRKKTNFEIRIDLNEQTKVQSKLNVSRYDLLVTQI